MSDRRKIEDLCNWILKGDLVRINGEDAPATYRHFERDAEDDEAVLQIACHALDGSELHLFSRQDLLSGSFDENGDFCAKDWRGRKSVVEVLKVTPDRFPQQDAWLVEAPVVSAAENKLDKDKIMAALKPFAAIFGTDVCSPNPDEISVADEWYRNGESVLKVYDFMQASSFYLARNYELMDNFLTVAAAALYPFAGITASASWNEDQPDDAIWWQHDGHILKVGDFRRARDVIQEVFKPTPQVGGFKP